MKTLLLLFAVCCAAIAQQAQPRKVYQPPEYRAFSPLVAKDEGCAKDLAKAETLEGLELRKYLSDLLRYDCVFMSEFMNKVHPLEFRELAVSGKKIMLWRVDLFPEVGSDHQTKNGNVPGWILRDQVIDITHETKPKWAP